MSREEAKELCRKIDKLPAAERYKFYAYRARLNRKKRLEQRQIDKLFLGADENEEIQKLFGGKG